MKGVGRPSFVTVAKRSVIVCEECGRMEMAQVASTTDRLCGLVVRVSGYRYRGPGFDPRRYQIS